MEHLETEKAALTCDDIWVEVIAITCIKLNFLRVLSLMFQPRVIQGYCDFSVPKTVSALRSKPSINKRSLKYSTLVYVATPVEVTVVGGYIIVRSR
jgi:hypothetical protein